MNISGQLVFLRDAKAGMHPALIRFAINNQSIGRDSAVESFKSVLWAYSRFGFVQQCDNSKA